ncbi:hypothetical protein ACVXG7_04580 [Enterobacter hormaechei]
MARKPLFPSLHVLRHDAEKYDADLAHHQEGLLAVLNHAGFNLLWRDNDGGCKGAATACRTRT